MPASRKTKHTLPNNSTRQGRPTYDGNPFLSGLSQYFDTLCMSFDEIVIFFDIHGSILFANQQLSNKLGYHANEIPELHFDQLFPRKNKKYLDILIKAKTDNKPLRFELPVQTKNGRLIPGAITISKLEAENGTLYLAIIRDITSHKRLEVEISMMSHALKNVSEALSVFNLEGKIIFVNDAFVRIYGYQKEELIGQPMEKFHYVKEFPSGFRHIIKSTLEGKWQGELKARRKNDQPFVISFRTSLVSDDEGMPVVIVGVAQDITEKKELEEQLRQSQKMEAIGQLAGGIAHDFNNLLTVIEGYTEMLIQSPNAQSAVGYGRQIKKAAERATALTRQLLAFSRRQILQPKVLDINALVNEISQLLQRLIGEDVELRTQLDSQILPIKADRNQIEQILMNMAVNARDAMPNGGVLTIQTGMELLDEEYVRHNPEVRPGYYVKLTISDTGVGIEKDIQTRIFEPFFTTKGKSRGTGLGLATVYGIVKQSEGHICLQSEPGKGTRFDIFIPAVNDEIPSETVVENKQDAVKGNETILVVEDEFLVRELVCDTLRNHGYTVLEATNGKEAIEIFKENMDGIDLVLTDVIMPEMSGRKLLENLKEKRPKLKSLYMSGYTDDAIIKQGVLAPGMFYIQKPFTPRSLLYKIQEVIRSG